ncbi:MAG: c-type cytochrome [Bacteroidetes bacterium]|nr:c-type cytochrome [Bacteroidota bacterium]
MKKTLLYPTLFFTLVVLFSCNSEPEFNFNYYSKEEKAVLDKTLNLPDLPDDYTVELPQHLRNAGLFARASERDKAILGRVLFYDTKLSKDGTISCGSCHKQNIAFGDERQFSLGVNNSVGERNSISLYSVANFSAYYGTDLNGSSAIRFFWDNRAATAKDQSTGSITNPLEMNMHGNEIVAAVQNQDYYAPLFTKAFGDQTVSFDRVLDALSNFVNAMGSYNSKFDLEANKIPNNYGNIASYSANFSGFTSEENKGKALFMTHCASCHTANMGRPALYSGNNGLYEVYPDQGVGGQTKITSDMAKFKVPTLRNIAITAPYMHDGSLKTLDDVLEHYNTGIKNHPNLSSQLKVNGVPKHDFLSPTDKQNIIAFLNTLTDQSSLTDKRYSNPFKQ